MKYNDFFDIDVLSNNTSLQLSPQSVSFSLHDSIFRFYSNGNVNINDNLGMLQEYGFFSNGNQISLFLGDTTNTIKNNFVINSHDLNDTVSSGTLNGKVTVDLIHQYLNNQEIAQKHYKDTVSVIVSKIIKDFRFYSSDIDSTIGDTDFYRLNQTQEKFILETLLPNCFDGNESPFYCFIDSNNVFNFKSWQTMYSSSPIEELFYKRSKEKDYYQNKIFSIKPFSTKRTNSKLFDKKTIYFRNETTGEYEEKNIASWDYSKNKKEKVLLPIISEKLLSDYDEYSFRFNVPGEREAFDGRVVNNQRDCMFYEMFEIKLHFNPKLTSGKTINLDIRFLDKNLEESVSMYYSGKYLIEDSIHSWDGNSKRPITTLIVGRKFVDIPETYNIKKRLFSK